MLKALSELIDQAFGSHDGNAVEDDQHALNLATALLLIEVARADQSEDLAEAAEIEALLRKHFDLTEQEITVLLQEARAKADSTASLQAFTRTLHEHLDVPEKHRIIEMLWRVALADEVLDKHEDHLIRRISGLLYVSHADLIRIRNRVHDKYN